MTAVTQYLKIISDLRTTSRPHPYTTPELLKLSTEAFVLKHGKSYPFRKKPRHVKYGKIKNCFQNAAMLALDQPDKYTYVEGYALGIIPVHHAWVIDRDGFVVDNTWRPSKFREQDEYFGVEIPTEDLRRVLLSGKTWGVLSWPNFYEQESETGQDF